MSARAGTALVIGGGGYVGYRVARQLRAAGVDRLVVSMRGGDPDEFRARCERWSRMAGHDAGVVFAAGDLRSDAPFAGIEPRDVRWIVHSAANTHFNVDAATAQIINVEGTEKAVAFARCCPDLQAFVLISTVYAAGLRTGRVAEELLDEQGFANHYERSKWLSERVVARSGLPWRIVRTATIVTDDETGAVRQLNIVHKTTRLMFRGLLPIFPGHPDLPIYFVTGDEAARGIASATLEGSANVVYNLCPGVAQSCNLLQWLTWTYDALMRDPGFVRRGVIRPLFTDLETFECLARSVEVFSRDVAMRAVVDLVGPFAKQMFSPKQVENRGAEAMIRDWSATQAQQLIERMCACLVAGDWGAVRADDPMWQA